MRFECGDPKCHNNQKIKLYEENKLKSYCDICDEDSTRWQCHDSRCKNFVS